jgi:hypothetical protein
MGAAIMTLREWIKQELNRQTIVGTIWSDTDASKFEALTNVTHKTLLSKWFGYTEGKGDLDYNKTGDDPRFTTCTSFLPNIATRIRRAGNLPTTKHNSYNNTNPDIKLRAFELNKEQGWVSASSPQALEKGPKEGDFFQLQYTSGKYKGQTEHVGVIYQIGGNGSMWSCVAGGAGGRSVKHDGVKRTDLLAKPAGIMGWLDVDEYFKGWDDNKTSTGGSSGGWGPSRMA